MKIYYAMMLFFVAVILIPALVSAETTFFDQDDAFIMGSSPTSGITGGTTGGGGCTYKWNCTNWGECLPSRKQIRTCTNIGSCSNIYNSPKIEQNCTYTPSPKVEEDKKLEKENVTKEEEEPVEISEDESTEEKPIGKHNYLFYAAILVAVLVLGWIYYLWKKK